MSSWAVRNAIGVNTHLDYTIGAYTDLAAVQRALAEIGVTHVRDAFQAPVAASLFQTLAATGVRFDVVIGVDQPVEWQLAQIEANAGLVEFIEGPNESDIWTKTYNGLTGLDATRAMQRDVYAFAKNSAALAATPVIQASLALGTSFAPLGDQAAYADYGNIHAYFGTGNTPGSGLPALLDQAEQVSPGRPVIATEGGYYTAPDATGGVSELAQAKYTLNLLFDNWDAGISRTYLYELADQRADPGNTDFHLHFGLYNSDWTPKPAARALANLTTLLGGPGGTAPGTLAYQITGLPGTGHDTLMQRADGSFVLGLWNDVRNWDPVTLTDRSTPPVPMALDLGQSYQRIQVFDPLVSATIPIASYVNTRHVDLALLDHPVLVVIGPELSPVQPLVSVVRNAATEGTSLGNVWADVIAAGALVDPGRTLTVTSLNLTGTRGYVGFDAASQTLSYLASGYDAGAPVDSFSYTLTDQFGQTVSGLYSVDVSGPAMPTVVGTVAGATVYGAAPGMRLISQAPGQRLNGAAGGNSLFFAGPDTAVAAYGLGNTIIAAPGDHASIATGSGNATVRMGDGNQVVVAPGAGNRITLGTGASSVSATGGDGWVTIAGGDNQVYVTGPGNVVRTGSGADRITSTGGAASIDAGDGTNQVTANGGGNTVRTGSGDDLIQGSSGASMLDAGSGADTIRFGGAGSVVNGGDGDDAVYDSGSGNTVVLNRAGDGVDDIYGNLSTNGVRFDLRATLSGTGWDGDGATLARFIAVATVAGDTTVTVTPTGSGAGSAVAVLHGTGPLSFADFVSRSDLPGMGAIGIRVTEGQSVSDLWARLADVGRQIDPWSRGSWTVAAIDTTGLRVAGRLDLQGRTLDYQATGFDPAASVDSMGFTLADGLGHQIAGRLAFTIDGPARPTLVSGSANATVRAT
ncbi:MAG: calcium-binding protein, partial [Gemmatimonadaceae bacterium]|nr:calcium-binding protein [Acetobacteraceae bacterium]